MLTQELIRRERDGLPIDAADLAAFVRGIVEGSVSEGQIAAFAMAVFFNGMRLDECVALTLAQRDSGEVLNWAGFGLHGPVIDKHSTGGVGDLTSLLVGPLVAACGGHVPMISGRGLGHTGGTLDKLASIPGYDLTPDTAYFQQVVKDVGIAIIGQTAQLAPADRRIYAIRDVTATVESVALITASILSKKLAAGADALVMDVKVGCGAFMPTRSRAVELARSIVDVGNGAGMKTTAWLTDMNQPLAPCAGNALEIRFAIDYLTGRARPTRVHDVTMALATQMLVTGGLAADATSARAQLDAALSSGAAAERFARMVRALGGAADLVDAPDRCLQRAPVVMPVPAPVRGVVARIDCREIGLVVVSLGGGRRHPEDAVDHRVGLTDLAELGQVVEAGQPLAMVHARDTASAAQAARDVLAAYAIETNAVMPELPVTLYELID
ncbi:thymidine phosphorylase [Paraburkholderia phosphatilytica]|uniref:thymidine phosphorylase n=1 Tax=Paraburkholderia phosphatilytica TaxID=2282883 RepID=UPI001F0C5D17|nr:thymidine phosphorylase [Paraburkholderia phosphatilytica]